MTNDEAPTQRFPETPATTSSRSGLVAGQRVFSRYLLEAQVGRGGMGVVWRAQDEKLDRPVALKFLPPEVAADAEAVRDLKLETRRCLDLTHVNIVRVYDFVEEPGGAAIAMEYVQGESLAKIKASAPGGCLGTEELTPFVAQLCGALRYAHHVAQVAHHDLKPANVLVTAEGVVKVTDFGIARSLTETQTRLTGKGGGATSGTLLYMSPQQLAGEKPTVADDVYALGALLYELLTGKPPFFRGDAVSLREQVMKQPPAPLEAHRRDVNCSGPPIPVAWSQTILACLAKAPEDRPVSTDDVAARLGIALEPLTTTHRGASFGRAAAPTVGAVPPRRALAPWLVAIGAITLGLAGAGIYFGIFVPEEKRLAEELAHDHEVVLARQAERARRDEEKRRAAAAAAAALAVEARKQEEAARAKAAQEQEAYSAIMARIAALTDNSPPRELNQTGQAVRQYARTAPETYRDLVEKAWNERQAARRALADASRPGTLAVETDPPGATVVLYPRNERKSSPALFEDVKPGEVTVRLEKEGFEAKDVPFVVKPGIANKLPPVSLVATYGSLAITSDPPDIYVLVEGIGQRHEGRTPFNPAALPPGEYRVTWQKPGWRPVVKNVTVERGKQGKAMADLKGFALDFRSVPPGAQVAVNRQPLGVLDRPIHVASVEPREYLITATLDGYEPYSRTITVTRNETVAITLIEKPLPHALRRLAGTRWRYDSFATSAELAFTVQGKISGVHHSGFASQVRDAGVAESFNPATNTITARFAGNPARAFYGATVQIKLVDDDHLAVSWTEGSSTERLVFERSKVPKE